MERIEGRTAFITGAARGIGLAVAEALVAAGAHADRLATFSRAHQTRFVAAL